MHTYWERNFGTTILLTDSPSKVKILWYLRHPPFVFYTYLQAFHQQDVGFFLAEGGVPCASSIMAQHACVPGESWYHLRLLDWGLWRHQRRVEREVSDPGHTSWICLCHLGSHLHLGRHLCCGTDVSLSQHQPSGWHRHTLVDICLLLPGGMDAFLCSGPDSRIPGVHVGNPSRFGHGHSAHRLPTRDLPEGVLLAEGTFFIALWMDHRRECLEYQRPCRLLHVIARDNADVSHGALTASDSTWRPSFVFFHSLCFHVFPFFPNAQHSGGVGLRVCSLDVAQPFATVCNRSQKSATVRKCSHEVAMAVPTGNAAKVVTFKGFKRCFAWQAWHFVTLSFQESFCVTGTILLHRFQKMISKFRGRRSTLDVTCCVLFANRVDRAASRRDTVKIAWQAWDIVRVYFALYIPHSTLYTLHFAFYTLHFTLDTPHSTLYTPRSTVYTPHTTVYTPHFTLHILYTLHFVLHTLHSTLYTPHSALYTPHLHLTLQTPDFTLHTLHSTLHTLHFTLHTLHCTLHTLQFTLHTLHFTLFAPYSALYTPHFTLYTLYSILCTLHFTLHTLHFTLHTLHLTLHTPDSTLYTPHSTLYTLHFALYILHLTLYIHLTLHTLQCTLHTLHFVLHTTLYAQNFTFRNSHSTPYTLHSPLNTPLSSHSTLCTPLHSTLHSLHRYGNRGRMYVTSVPFTYVWAFEFVPGHGILSTLSNTDPSF